MKLLIDALDSITGWTGYSGASIYGLNEIPDFIAGLGNAKSIIFKFNALNSYVEKTINVDVSNYDEITFHFWTRTQKNKGLDYRLSTDFVYKIDFGTGTEYYIPTYYTFSSVTIDVSSLTTLSRIRITALHSSEDYIIMSNMITSKDEFPRDIFIGVKEQLEYDANKIYPKVEAGVLDKGILLGTASGAVNDKSIILTTSYKYLDKYAVIRIDDGVNSEIHQLDKNDGLEFYFNSMYSGLKLLNNYTNANVYLIIPAEYGLSEKEIILPCFSIWGMNPEEINHATKLDNIRDSFKVDETVQSRLSQVNFNYPILIDCEARQNELIAIMSKVVRNMIAREYFWVNGKKVNIKNAGASTYIEATEGYNQIPKIQYTMNIEIREEIFDRETQVKTITNNITYNIL